MPVPFRSPINVRQGFESPCFSVLCRGSLVIGAGGTEDIGKEGKSTRDTVKLSM